MSNTRNISQSLGVRDIIKLSSDVIIYIDGQNYLVNPFLQDTNNNRVGVIVQFNNYVSSWTSSYSVESTIPSGTLTLSVPVQDDHLFRAPGGNNLIQTMSEIRVFAKGYYFSSKGNTLYHQIFKGFISSVQHSVTGKVNTISISCFGSLGMLERMQIDTAPALMSNAGVSVTNMTSTTWSLNPYQQIAYIFLYSSMLDAATRHTFDQAAVVKQAGINASGNRYYDAITSPKGYIAKWQAYLFDLARDVHIYGVNNVQDVITLIQSTVKNLDQVSERFSKLYQAIAADKVGTQPQSSQVNAMTPYINAIRKYTPEQSFGNISLFGGRTVSRLERLRFMTNLIGFEAYQDIDGSVVIKPPLYNLDVTNIGAFDAQVGVTYKNNPFIVHLSEISEENESEDESAVRLTRIAARMTFSQGFQMPGLDADYGSIIEEFDMKLLSQYGLRTEEPKDCHMFVGDAKGVFAWASSELTRSNRGLRTYNFSIPLRPELKLGFPMYIPHRDMYGYIKNVSINWSKGGGATMNISLDSLRRRPVFPVTQTYYDPVAQENKTINLLTNQQNLVFKWVNPSQSKAIPQGQQSFINTDSLIASLPLPQGIVFDQEIHMLQAIKNGNSYFPNPDDTTNSWQIQVDDKDVFTNETRLVDNSYFDDMNTTRPYTDSKGYEVIGFFPFGRGANLTTSIKEFTIQSTISSSANKQLQAALPPISGSPYPLNDMTAFLFDATANVTDYLKSPNSSSEDIISVMAKNSSSYLNDNKVFELTYDSNPSQIDPFVAPTITPQETSDKLGDLMVNMTTPSKVTGLAAKIISSVATSEAQSDLAKRDS